MYGSPNLYSMCTLDIRPDLLMTDSDLVVTFLLTEVDVIHFMGGGQAIFTCSVKVFYCGQLVMLVWGVA